jgi:hypothetical protein
MTGRLLIGQNVQVSRDGKTKGSKRLGRLEISQLGIGQHGFAALRR